MRKILAIFAIVTIFSISQSMNKAAAIDYGNVERIKNYGITININESGRIDVIETIHYYFDSQKHGIFREVPRIKTNQDGKKFVLDFSNVSVVDETGKKYKFTHESDSKNFVLKIGDAGKTVAGDHTYVISYTVSGALTYFTDHDELYWNAIGTGWDVPIESSTATVNLPQTLQNLNNIDYACYTGISGSTETNCVAVRNGASVIFKSGNIKPNHGMTIVTGFPKGYVQVLEPKKDYTSVRQMIIIALIALVAFSYYIVAPIWIFYQWLKNRKHKGEDRVASAWFEPPNTKEGRSLTAPEVGVVYDKTTDIRDLTSMLIQLAQRGYLKIIQDKKDKNKFYLNKLSEGNQSELLGFEKKLLDSVFKEKDMVEVKKLNKRSGFVKDLMEMHEQLSDQLVRDDMFANNAYKTEKTYSTLIGVGALGFNIFWIIASILARKSTPRTDAGAYAAAQIKSLRNFLKSQDEQLEFQAKNQMFFEKLLPYAIALGVEKVWIKRFKDIEMAQPAWLESDGFNNLVYYSMIRDFNSSVMSATSMSSSRSSSGFSSGFSGGSSGGGGGGGGGGSW